MQRPIFSILSWVHDTEVYLAETIASVVAQSLADWELIVVDDGMSDEVVRILGKYENDPRIHLVRRKRTGPGDAIDVAAAMATGRYYAVLDSDDLLMPDFCARAAAILDAHPSIDVVGIDAFLFEDSDGQDIPLSYRQSAGVVAPTGLDRAITLAEFVAGQIVYYTAAIRADAWAKGGGYGCDTPKAEDLGMFMRMLAGGCDIRVIDEPLARYRLRADSFSRDPAKADAFDDSLERAFTRAMGLSDAVEVQQALEETLRRIRFDRAMRNSRMSLMHGDIADARQHAKFALRQRHALRPAIAVVGLTVAPGLLRRVRPLRQWVRRNVGSIARR